MTTAKIDKTDDKGDGPAIFHDFMRRLGFNKKQVVAAGEALGWGRRTTLSRTNGTVAVTESDRLAMMAAALRLPAWEIGDADAIDEDCLALARALRARIEARRRGKWPSIATSEVHGRVIGTETISTPMSGLSSIGLVAADLRMPHEKPASKARLKGKLSPRSVVSIERTGSVVTTRAAKWPYPDDDNSP